MIPKEGGTGVLSFHTISVWVPKLVIDSNGMGIWSWIKMKVKYGNECRIVYAWQPCGKTSISPGGLGIFYDQQIRYQR